jgi:lysophospholipase L1-like esterase
MTIFLAGDSTCAYNGEDTYPQTGWGQKLSSYLHDDTQVSNYGINGRSTKSFIEEGWLAEIGEKLREGDWLFVQFGHNDEKEAEELHTDPYTTFQENLRKFHETAAGKGARTLFLTPIYRRHFIGNLVEEHCHGAYPLAMITLAKELGDPLIDLNRITGQWLNRLGEIPSREFFMIFGGGIYDNYPDGSEDNTHLRMAGADKIASFVAMELVRVPEIYEHVRKSKG